ncbi:mask [Symbiodinium pilosum]|uniref:Mask protein n=1 Tax=Symbiodinium pilosum TaxID=2952 RepID=A0A812PCT6_SYMPI|nr:mask [Symbiodinium pilosum]
MNLPLLRSRAFAGDRVGFDLLKRWISNAFMREVRDTSPVGCPWQSLISALEESRRRRWREARAEGEMLELDPITEADIRTALVHAYQDMPPAAHRAVAEAKLKDELSIFQMAHFPDADAVIRHWKWYLHCLTFESHEFTSDGTCWDKFPDLDDPCIVRMPLDCVDLQILARIFKVQITVSRLGREALRLLPSEEDGCEDVIHLIMHAGLWAALLSSRAPIPEADIVGAVVKLSNDLSCFQDFANKTACILSYDEVQDFCTACVGRYVIPVQRDGICRIIACDESRHHPRYRTREIDVRSREIRRSRAHLDGPGPGDAPSFFGIPDGSLEFQVLLDLVTQMACERLLATRSHLKGEVPVKPDRYARYLARLEDLAPLPSNVEVKRVQLEQPYIQRTKGSCGSEEIISGRRSLEEVVQMLDKGSTTVWILCPCTFTPPVSQRNSLLSCQYGAYIGLISNGREFSDGSKLFLAKPAGVRGAHMPRWVSSDVICQFSVKEEFAPSSEWPYPQEFLSLSVGDLLLITDRATGKWEGWARGRLWKSHGSQEGLFPLHCVKPELYVKSWYKEGSERESQEQPEPEDEPEAAPVYPPRQMRR